MDTNIYRNSFNESSSWKIIIANKANENSMFPVYGMIDLLGCTEGRRRNGLTCDICPKGTYSNIIGSNT